MQVDRTLSKRLAQLSYVNNVLNGGVVKPSVAIKKEADKYVVNVVLPSVDPDSLTAELDMESLYIFQEMKMDGNLKVPYLIQQIHVPSDVELDQISMEYESGKLIALMPFNDLAGGFHKDLDIIKH